MLYHRGVGLAGNKLTFAIFANPFIAIDDLLAAPELVAPPELVQPKVLYEFAEPQLQSRSAGQKIMMRMGPENAKRVKAKLREIRRELIQR